MSAKDLVAFFIDPKATYTSEELSAIYAAYPGDGRPFAEQLLANRNLIEASPKGGRLSRESVSRFLRNTQGTGTPQALAQLLANKIDADVISAEDLKHIPVAVPLWLLEEIAWALESLDKDASTLYRFVLDHHGYAVAAQLPSAVRD